MFDSFLIGVSASFPSIFTRPGRPPLNFADKKNYFTTWYIKLFLKLLRTVPVESRKDPKLLRRYKDLIENNNLLIFYQGTRSYDLNLIKNGPGYLIASAAEKITVIPVFHQGIERIFSRGGPKTHGTWRWLPRNFFRKPLVIFGPAINFSQEMQNPEMKKRILAINKKIISSIMALQALATNRQAVH
jgi:1-acyl-sn-glycerol-3-phosphate acyltransferase